MRTSVLALTAGIGAQLVLTGRAGGEFTGTFFTFKPDYTVNVYACFDAPGEDHLISVYGTINQPLMVEVLNGTFFQHTLGGDTPPNPALFEFFPELRHDTFVTIGVKSFNPNDPGRPEGQPEDHLTLTPAWPGFGESSLTLSGDGWAVLPDQAQGDPFNPDFVAGDGCVLVAQFNLEPLVPGGLPGILLQMPIQYLSNGVFQTGVLKLTFIGCLGADCDDGDPCNGVETCKGEECFKGVPCLAGCLPGEPSPDCNGNGLLDSCDIADGTSPDLNGNGVPDECDPPCPWDCAGDLDLHVTILDMLALLAQWGTVGTSCDLGLGAPGVGIDEFLDLLAHWGPCP